MHGHAPHREASAPVGVHAPRRQLGVAEDNLDVLERDAEIVGSDLGEGGFVAMAIVTFPVGRTRMLAASHPPAAYRRLERTRDGARPHISRYVENPIPSCLMSPESRLACCSLRSCSYPTSSRALSSVDS